MFYYDAGKERGRYISQLSVIVLKKCRGVTDIFLIILQQEKYSNYKDECIENLIG